ncbi:TPA: PTS sugar transporter subunit IIB [Enterococcus faecium]|nr:PTS sugar transporter subunit IIB [Enterococcus faecium]HBK5463843.1 PTS sugar transporter subunit IIB [Enterococcus faecium]
MNIIRCDDRLVHGQVIYRWLNENKLSSILIVDDDAATNLQEKNIIRMSVDKQYPVEILTVQELNNSIEVYDNYLILFRRLSVAQVLLNRGILTNDLIIGRLSAGIGKKKFSEGIFLSNEDVECLRFLDRKGIRIFQQMIPKDKAILLNDVLS